MDPIRFYGKILAQKLDKELTAMAKKTESPPFRPKMRVSLLDSKLVKVEDRLVSMDIEMTTGPKEKHKGPISVEITLRDQEDVTRFKEYLDRLVGDLPIAEKKVYKTGKKSVSLLDEEPLKELLRDMEKKCKSLDEIIRYLRAKGFVFVNYQFLEDSGLPIKLRPQHLEYQFLIRKIKEAKDPKNDKFDPQLIIGITFVPIKKKGAKVYLYNEFEKTLELDWETKSDLNFKKLKVTKFPPYMIKEERLRYRTEERKYQLNPELEKSKFWDRWNTAVVDFNKNAGT